MQQSAHWPDKVFKDVAQRGRTSEGWFFGFKLHIIVNDQGELLAVKLTPGNVTDSNQSVVRGLAKGLQGRLFADKGYISQDLFKALWQQGLKLATNVRRDMKNKLLPLMDKLMLRRRSTTIPRTMSRLNIAGSGASLTSVPTSLLVLLPTSCNW